ncbi:glycoside hydrolase family 43 protein [Flavobacterium quisquiliarum]|uniref:Family 43 glycosylhydrolase n=1 Tax=Flavobacterium quisquiliarum TaxID=1834436 RepID=A0ABV8W1T8_9FLAO|nr:glycoside hydrolase family 43 protein [Flavobacterium quisquiliarum]MBW1654600.1 family 43 glycosylhydrolase [Flavobacterium quisquiliarum]NWL01714.1 alpha-N-arabinofuranosidase [Flavobacterium collinsii]
MKFIRVSILAIMATMYSFQSYSQSIEFNNPIAEKRADPWVHKTASGEYYLIATVPEYDRIVLRKANSINGLKDAKEKEIWHKHKTGVMANHIWAPELHWIDGKWYIYFAAGEAENKWNIRIWVLSNSSADPMQGKWTEEGQIKTKIDSFSLDATTFVHNGKRYLIWAQNVRGGKHGTALVLSEMKNPTTLTGPEIVITEPEFGWEREKYNVNEGPAVIQKNGKIFVSYSASATNHNYCMGLLWINENADLLNVANWNKSPAPVFYTNEDLKRYGPGHNSFTTSEDGKTTIMIYHARDYKEIQGDELSDVNRATRARAVEWTESGFPDFMQNKKD